MKENLIFQNARSRWLKEGDAHSGFFHACINSKRRWNNIQALKKDETWLVEVEDVKEEVLNHFTKQFSEDDWDRPKLDGVPFKRIDVGVNDRLIAQLSEEEIKEAVWECEGNKSPGPDGFNFTFLRSF